MNEPLVRAVNGTVKAHHTWSLLLGLTLIVRAEEQPSELQSRTHTPDAVTPKGAVRWDDPKWWDAMKSKPEGIPLGKSDIRISGPLVNTFRRPPVHFRDLSFEQKLNAIPIVSLFVPQRFPSAPRSMKGDYFAWGESSTAWSRRAEGDLARPVSLISVDW